MKKFVKIALVAGTVLLVAAAAYWFMLPRLNKEIQHDVATQAAPVETEVTRLYGIAVDSFIVEKTRSPETRTSDRFYTNMFFRNVLSHNC